MKKDKGKYNGCLTLDERMAKIITIDKTEENRKMIRDLKMQMNKMAEAFEAIGTSIKNLGKMAKID